MALSLSAVLIVFPQMTDSESIRFRDIAHQSGLQVAAMRLRYRYTNKNEKDRHAIITQGLFGSERSIGFRNYVVGRTSLRERPWSGRGR
jgi:hypothetical protein